MMVFMIVNAVTNTIDQTMPNVVVQINHFPAVMLFFDVRIIVYMSKG